MSRATTPSALERAGLPYATLEAIALHVGKIFSPRREPAPRAQMDWLIVDLGPFGSRRIGSIITGLGPDEPGVVEQQLIGKQVIVGCQIAPRMLFGCASEGVLVSGYLDPAPATRSLPLFVPET